MHGARGGTSVFVLFVKIYGSPALYARGTRPRLHARIGTAVARRREMGFRDTLFAGKNPAGNGRSRPAGAGTDGRRRNLYPERGHVFRRRYGRNGPRAPGERSRRDDRAETDDRFLALRRSRNRSAGEDRRVPRKKNTARADRSTAASTWSTKNRDCWTSRPNGSRSKRIFYNNGYEIACSPDMRATVISSTSVFPKITKRPIRILKRCFRYDRANRFRHAVSG